MIWLVLKQRTKAFVTWKLIKVMELTSLIETVDADPTGMLYLCY